MDPELAAPEPWRPGGIPGWSPAGPGPCCQVASSMIRSSGTSVMKQSASGLSRETRLPVLGSFTYCSPVPDEPADVELVGCRTPVPAQRWTSDRGVAPDRPRGPTICQR